MRSFCLVILDMAVMLMFNYSRFLSSVLCLNICAILCLSASSYRSIAAPRFDAFVQSLVGQWNFVSSSNSNNSNDSNEAIGMQHDLIVDVEEVMRSCGGAIQGLRENYIKLPGSVEMTRYHNRADDGFVFFEDGTYNSGPTSLRNDTNSDSSFLVSFSLNNSVRRAMLSFTLETSKTNAGPTISSLTFDEITRLHSSSSHNGENHQNDLISHSSLLLVCWENEILCRMPSTTNEQWILPRAKWETLHYSSSAVEELHVEQSSRHCQKCCKNGLLGWVDVISCQDVQSLTSCTDSWIKGGGNNDESGIISQVGVACKLTGEVRLLMRKYGEAGSLQGLALKKGMLIPAIPYGNSFK